VNRTAVRCVMDSYAEVTGPSWGRPGGFRAQNPLTSASPGTEQRQKAKTPSESRSAMQRFGYSVRNDTGLPRQVPTTVTSTGA
jgi:hypothetical protein